MTSQTTAEMIAKVEAQIKAKVDESMEAYKRLRKLPTDEIAAEMRYAYRVAPAGKMSRREMVQAILDAKYDTTYLERQLARLQARS